MATTKLSEQEVTQLLSRYPQVPTEYVSYLVVHGWGDSPNGKVIYNGPLTSEDVYGVLVGPPGLMVLGDDLAGYCFAYDPSAGAFGELDPNGRWSPWQDGTGFGAYVAA